MFLYRTKLYKILNPGQASPCPAVSEMGSMHDFQDPERAKALVMSEIISGGFIDIDINEQEAVFNKPRLGSADPNQAENVDH